MLSKLLLTRWRVLAGVSLALLAIALVSAAMVLKSAAGDAAQARKDPLALAFEAEAATWLARPQAASDFERAVIEGRIAEVAISGPLLLYTAVSGERASTRLVDCGPACTSALLSRLGELSARHGFALTIADIDPRGPVEQFSDSVTALGRPLGLLVLVLLAFGLLGYRMRGHLLGGGAELAEKPVAGFDDVIGAQEARRALRRVTAFMKDPGAYTELGARAPRGVLLEGPPGTGKTMLARALAGECGASFISVDGSYFSSMYFGAGIGKVKQLFAQARKHAPCIVFIDEIDGIGKRSNPGSSPNGGEQEQNRIINRLLVEMDGFSALENVVVVGATNAVDNVDPALRRPGRFDLVARVAMPTLPERSALFELYLLRIKAAAGIDVASLARTAAGMSPADIANCVNRAAAYAAEAGESEVGVERLYQSLEAHQLGGEVSSVKDVITSDTQRRIAVHEAGHAVVAHLCEAGSVERVSIEPRGGALGVTYVTRHVDEPLYGERELHSRLAMMLGGREAEMLVFGNTSSGAADDLRRATELATSMIGSYGFGKTFGLLSMNGMPRELIGPDLQRSLVDEAKGILEQAQARCAQVLAMHRDRLERLGELLLVEETISGSRLREILDGTDVPVARDVALSEELLAA